jgi:hypothetical protein
MLVRQQIHSAIWQEDFGRMLFQLMVPHDFKDAARQLDRIVLVVDDYTANLPWELMFADAPVARPAKAAAGPAHAGGPSTRHRHLPPPGAPGFRAHWLLSSAIRRSRVSSRRFADPRRPDAARPAAARRGARRTRWRRYCRPLGYQVELAGDRSDRRADVLTCAVPAGVSAAAHLGARRFRPAHIDGRRRTGVVLSDGLLITAAEIQAMETVPELVFLSCCHLGKVDAIGRTGATTALLAPASRAS